MTKKDKAKKDDLNQPLTKGDFLEFLGETGRFGKLETGFYALKSRFDKAMVAIHKRFELVDQRFDEIESKMVTQDQWSRHMELMDRIMVEIEQSRQERLFSGEQYTRMDDTVRDHGKRIEKLEKASA